MSSRIEAEVLERHALEAAVLWTTRDRAAEHGAYDLTTLRALDERVEAHLDGLLVAGDQGWAACKAALDNEVGGEVFAATVLAALRASIPEIGEVLDIVGGSPARAREMISALGWVPFERAGEILAGLADDGAPAALRYLGVAGFAAHRRDPGAALGHAAVSDDPRLAARACRAAGELGRADLGPELSAALGSSDTACRFWASWSAALLGAPELARAVGALWAFAAEGGRRAERACQTAVRRTDPAAAAARIQALAPTSPRTALAGAAALGDPALLPWIVEQMTSPAHGRAAGAAFSTITGADIIEDKLRGRPPEGFEPKPNDDPRDEDTAMDADENLPWPDAAAAGAWLRRRAKDFVNGTRYLGGAPIAPASRERVLRAGKQPARAAAAEERSIRLSPRRVLFEVRAPGFRQARLLAGT